MDRTLDEYLYIKKLQSITNINLLTNRKVLVLCQKTVKYRENNWYDNEIKIKITLKNSRSEL